MDDAAGNAVGAGMISRPPLTLDEAYRQCEEITNREARNFSYGIRLLPGPKRRAMSVLYALARRIDDIGDGEAPAEDRLVALAGVRTDLRAVRSDLAVPATPDAGQPDPGAATDPVLIALADVERRFAIPMAALDELVDGCEMDVHGTRYDTFDELVGYCRKVAGTVGRLSLGVYGCARPAAAEPLADALGVALQITNILRDIVEDRDTMGRVYLPTEDLERFGCEPDLTGPIDGVTALVAFESIRAEEWYQRGLPLLPLLDRRSRACTAAMAGIYRRLLEQIRRDPAAVLRGRLSVPGWRKGAVAIRSLTRGEA